MLPKYLTVSQAADLLNVSLPYMSALLDDGTIPFINGGKKRLVETEFLVNYKMDLSKKRREVLEQLTKEAVEMGLYDD